MSAAPRRKRAASAKVQMTLRLPQDLAQRVALAARVDGLTFTAFVHDTLEDALSSRKGDPDFQRRLAAFQASEADAFRKLTGGDEP